MPVANSPTLAFNRGILSELGLARTDIARYRMSADIMTNWMARVLGSMMLRPGQAYLTGTAANAQARSMPFIFGATDTARVEVTEGALRVLVNDTPVTRVSVGTTIENGNFATSIADWTNSSDAGCTVAWAAAGEVSFIGSGGTAGDAQLDQEVTVAPADQGNRHALRIIVVRGPFTFSCGTSQGDDSLINQTTLYTGTHSLAFTPPGGAFWIRFSNNNLGASLLGTANIEAGPSTLSLPAPWQTADFQSLRWAQSADVIFIGCQGGPEGNGYPLMQVERRATDSWSIVQYPAFQGPFRPINITNVTMAASAIQGNIQLTTSKPTFKNSQVGALFRLISNGQLVSSALSGVLQYTGYVLVTGVGAARNIVVTVGGVFTGTLSVQYSLGTPGNWVDQGQTYGNGGGEVIFNDSLDNQDIYYRIGFDAGNYGSGTANVSLAVASGSITGVCLATGYVSNTVMNAVVITPLGGTQPVTTWYEGAWSVFRGFPGVPRLWGGRLWWFGSGLYASVSDDYTNFDDTTVGDSAPIIGQLDAGPVDNIYWAVALQQLVVGTASQETSCRSTYLGDPVTDTNFNIMTGSTQGSANVDALQVDLQGIFVQVSGSRVFSLNLDIYTYSYKSEELTLLVPDLNSAGIIQIAVQRKPDTRIHCLRADGTVGIMVYDQTENVQCWLEYIPSAGGVVEDISVLPAAGIPEDQVYYITRRVVNGQTVRYHEKWALESECTGLPVSRCLDSHVVFSAEAPTAYLAGIAPHLVGQTVAVWGWNTVTPYTDGNSNTPGLNLGTYVVGADGSVDGLVFEGDPYPVTNAIVGLPYTAQWESMKQSFTAAMGTALNQFKRLPQVGLILQNTQAQGILIGNDFEHLDPLPQDDLPRLIVDDEEVVDLNAILNNYDKPMFGFDDVWTTDSRVCLQATGPSPCTVLAFTAKENTEDANG